MEHQRGRSPSRGGNSTVRTIETWGIKRSGASLTVNGTDRATGKWTKVWPVELVWVEDGRVFAAIQDDIVELAI